MSHGAVSPSFGRFQSLQVVRHDGATTHHTAFDPELKRSVALITAPAGPDRAEEDRLAFRLPRMRHPNIVSVLAAGLEGDVAFVAAECLQAEALSAFVARPGRMPFFQGLPLVLQLLSAIEHAQARRLVHSGIDTEHVQVTPGGQPKLPADGWSLSADRQPNLEDAARVARVVLCGSCPPALRGALEQVLLRAEASDPAGRYQRADEFILALLAAAGYPVGGKSAAVEVRTAAEPQRAAPVVVPEQVEPIQPIQPVEPILHAEPVEPVEQVQPVEPKEPIEPVLLAEPVEPKEPIEPVLLAEPVEPIAAVAPLAPVAPVAPVRPVAPVEPILLAEPIEPAEPILVADPIERIAPMEPVEPVLHVNAVPARAVRHAARRPLQRRRTGRHVLAACLLAALFVPGWVGERMYEARPGASRPSETVALGAAPARLEPAALVQPAAAHVNAAHVAPAPIAPTPVAPTSPSTVALASMTAPPPVHASAVQSAPVETPAVVTPPVETRAVERSPAERAPRAPSHAAAPSPAAESAAAPVAVAPHRRAAKPVTRPAVRQHAERPRQFASADAVRAKPAWIHGRTARPQRARVVTAASGCPYDVPVFRELCEARQCSRPELRHDPACVRMQAEQRAALARLRGTPD